MALIFPALQLDSYSASILELLQRAYCKVCILVSSNIGRFVGWTLWVSRSVLVSWPLVPHLIQCDSCHTCCDVSGLTACYCYCFIGARVALAELSLLLPELRLLKELCTAWRELRSRVPDSASALSPLSLYYVSMQSTPEAYM